jgi:hypothetical protein
LLQIRLNILIQRFSIVDISGIKLVKCDLTGAQAYVTLKTTDAGLCLCWGITLLLSHLNTPPASDAILVPKAVLFVAITANLGVRQLKFHISTICFRPCTFDKHPPHSIPQVIAAA